MIGRYRIKRRLGRGGFAVVYLAHDLDLDRHVAIKVPRPDQLPTEVKLQQFVEEARKTAQFDHHGIVRVFDVQREPSFVYIVEQYIDGADLASYAKSRPCASRDAAELMVAIAEAVGYAHQRGFVHRDLKPSNILMDHLGAPYVADFGLAIHENKRFGLAGELAGTYPYMSPEQARGESHRLDSRSDIWSLGVILYQLLTKQLPFRGKSRDQLLSSIIKDEPNPITFLDRGFDSELSRICSVCLAKPAGDRFQSADELILDLRDWLIASESSRSRRIGSDLSLIERPVEPQGLRPFEQRHASFFPQLLPGPHDRDGLPKCIRFWLARVETRQSDETFSVGLMYGPSGCGKSSILQAGILPRLSDQIVPIVIEASCGETVARVQSEVMRVCQLPGEDSNLASLLQHVRQLEGISGRKLLIVIDQFEQHLRANDEEETEQLVAALRQADGAAVQVLILVRDDFYGSLNRFFNRLEVPILEGHNAQLADPFDLKHARDVLTAFGRALGQVPQFPSPPTRQNQKFVEHAVDALQDDGKVNSVRLAVFAQMMGDRPWNEQSFRDVGGIDGLGITFLQEQFSRTTSPPNQRLHESAIREILRELAADDGNDLKGSHRSLNHLLKASGYGDRPDDFDAALKILDKDVRLITPVEKTLDDAGPNDRKEPSETHYQLAHDYLTHAIRQWVNQHQLETRRGRAQLCLEQRSKAYLRTKDRKSLVSLPEFVKISLLTSGRLAKPHQRTMMRAARRVHLTRAVAVLACVIALAGAWFYSHSQRHTSELVSELLLVGPEAVPGLINKLNVAWWPDSILHQRLARAAIEKDSAQRIKLSLALRERDPSQFTFLRSVMTDPQIPFEYLPLLSNAIWSSSGEQFRSVLMQKMQSAEWSDAERFRAGIGMAHHTDADGGWTKSDRSFIASQLLSVDPDETAEARDCLRPIGPSLVHPLLDLMKNQDELSGAEQIHLAAALADYAVGNIEVLAIAISRATPEQFAILYAPLATLEPDSVRGELMAIAQEVPEPKRPAARVAVRNARVAVGKQRAAAAITLLRLGQQNALPHVLAVKEDPESLTQFVHGLKSRGIESGRLFDCLQSYVSEGEIWDQATSEVLFGLLLALGEFNLQEFPDGQQSRILELVEGWYETHASSGVHGAAGWLLRKWNKGEIAKRIDRREIPFREGREWFTVKLGLEQIAETENQPEPLYLTFVVYEPGKLKSGGRVSEPGWTHMEHLFFTNIPRRFAILDRELNHRQVTAFKHFSDGYKYKVSSLEQAYGGLNWYETATYCRWMGGRIFGESNQPYDDPLALRSIGYTADPARAAQGAPRNWPVDLDRRGVRLATECEWEYACRAETDSTWSFGCDRNLYSHYAWNLSNTMEAREPGLLRPNRRGLFDMHGNRAEWCHDWLQFRDWSKKDASGTVHYPDDKGGPETGETRVVRGGSFADEAHAGRSGSRAGEVPSLRKGKCGLRLVMILPHESK